MLRQLLSIAALCTLGLETPLQAQQSAVRNSVGFVQASIDGKGPYWFMVDSGANRSALDDDVAKALALTVTGTSKVEGTAGTIDVGQAKIRRLRAGVLDVRDLEPTVVDLSGSTAPEGDTLAGILGFDAVQRYAVLFDVKAGRVAFATKAGDLADLAGATIVPFELDNDIPRIAVTIEGQPVKLRIDTGAAIGDGPRIFLNITEAFHKQLLARDPSLTPYTHFTASGVGGEVKIGVVKARQASVGGAPLPDPRLIVQPPVGYFARGDAVGFLGIYAFKPWRGIILDYPGRRLILLAHPNGQREVGRATSRAPRALF